MPFVWSMGRKSWVFQEFTVRLQPDRLSGLFSLSASGCVHSTLRGVAGPLGLPPRGAMRGAIHALKYRGIDPVAMALAPTLVARLPSSATALIPVPRASSRRVRYGIDQGRTLARHVARLAGLPVVDALRAPPFRNSQLHRRTPDGPRFRLVKTVPHGAVLVDDVITTGATLGAAATACGTGREGGGDGHQVNLCLDWGCSLTSGSLPPFRAVAAQGCDQERGAHGDSGTRSQARCF